MAMDKEERHGCYACCGCITSLGCILTLILVPLAYQKLEYFEHGIVQQKSTAKVDRETVYASGSHCIGPDYQFKKFQTSALYFSDTVSVWTKATGDDAGATLNMDVSFVYKIEHQKIGKMYTQLGTAYEPMIRSYAIDALRNTAPLFGADDFLEKRAYVEQVMARNVSRAIEKVFCRVLALQLRRVNFDSDYKAIKLTTAIQEELNEAENYVQQSQIIRLETDVEASVTENEARHIKEKARSRADFLVARARADFDAQKEAARSEALSAMYASLGIDTEAQRVSLDYMLTLTTKQRMESYVDFTGGVAWSR